MADRFFFSPSIYHQQLMKKTVTAMAFDGSDLKQWQARLRKKVRQLVGMPRGTRVPLNVRTLWTRQYEYGTIEKIVYTSQPDADVVAYVCLPDSVKVPYPFFVCLQGHTSGAHNSIAVDGDTNEESIVVEGDRDFGLSCMARGVAALCIEQRSFGERSEKHQEHVSEDGCHDAAMHALMLGQTLIGERVFDVDRGLDYLKTRNDVDWSRIGIMGNSGGGTISIYAAALLSRLKFAMPSCSFCTFRDSLMSIYHCSDNYVPGMLRYAEMADVMGLFAPKPVVVVAGTTDEIFPIKGVRRAFRQLKAIYKSVGAENHCHLVVGPGGHRFYAKLGWTKMLAELHS
ncbi:alpha/beta hydrolase family protein [bacterium]|nr:alpha/beta hydrolase family protein [bacterium]